MKLQKMKILLGHKKYRCTSNDYMLWHAQMSFQELRATLFELQVTSFLLMLYYILSYILLISTKEFSACFTK